MASTHLDWIEENGSSKYQDRDAKTKRLIRRRAIQAGVLTKQERQLLRPQFQSLNWVVPSPLDLQYNSASTPRAGIRFRSSFKDLSVKVPSNITEPTVLFKPSYCIRPAPTLPQHAVANLRALLSSPTTLRILMRLPVPDEQVRYFITLALADAQYIQAICSHYGRSTCLDTAIECLGARMQDLLTNSNDNMYTVRLYLRFLHTLQKAIRGNPFSERFEIYYAIPLLVLFELLNPSDGLAFLTHARGAVYLLHFIGPRGMTSDLDKTLLAMQSDIMVVENLRDRNTHCCAKSEWQDALRQTIQLNVPPESLRSEASITLNIIATALPDILNEVETSVENPQTSLDVNLVHRLTIVQCSLQDWSDRWNLILCKHLGDPSQFSARRTLLAIYMMYTAIVNRLTATILVLPKQRLESESKALQAAYRALEIVTEANPYDMIGQSRLALVSTFMRSITETSSAWQLAMRCAPPVQTINKALFESWCLQMGRETRQSS